MDFGSLLCWADNMVGNQKHTRPCIFHIIPTGPPESPGECRSINQTETQIMVQCRLGYSGGLPQHIHLEIYSSSGYILANMSGTGERLGLVTLHGTNLSPGSQLQLVVYSSNSKGRSQVVKLDGYTLDKDYANKVLEPPVEFQFEHVPNLSVVFVSLTVTILILVISMFLISAYRRSQANSRTAQKGSAERRDHQIQDFGIQRSPDIIKDTPEDSGLNFQDINSKKMNTKTVSSPPEGGFSAGNHEWDETLYYGHQNRQTPQSHEHVLSRGFPIGEDPKDQPAWGEITGVLYEPAQSESISSYNYSHLPQRMQGLRLGLPLQCTAPSVSRVHHRTALLDEDRESCV
ncbi:uncharacterized protein LOC111712732 [Eurytemora carolleeae]|uniref:uncharacterized protein LOC111712732 n=1 Tax=Eurytemora carolleeae TaxID=1294199 RepID=UPI000C77D732|nr:uncharacterized protein LOC111712732 [Eurytemora carolleeae]|eukprot:XP_023343205.1 uncharacterized protein LOC111712732 [Eurytemora affinis]